MMIMTQADLYKSTFPLFKYLKNYAVRKWLKKFSEWNELKNNSTYTRSFP